MSISRTTRTARAVAAGLACLLLASGCSAALDLAEAIPADVAAVGLADSDVAIFDTALFDSAVVHNISVTFDDADYDEMIETFETTGEKDWVDATVIIDGTTFQDAGVRLKGNSSLFGLASATSGNPEDLPWLIRLDKHVDDQSYQGYTDVVIRSSSTETALNEAVAQDLLDLAGLASQDPIATRFTVNGGETELRLALEHPDDAWNDAAFDDDGVLYKADSEGDYSYRGEDPEAYVDVFDQKAGDDDLQPLIDFLAFINTADDATFSAELGDRLDVEAFATYLAFQDLVGNADDINGRGNNSYLHYDYESGQVTVVNWDLNLAFGTANVGGGGGVGGGRPEGAVRGGGPPAGGGPAGGEPGGGAPGGGTPGGQSNVLVDRFLADEAFAALYEAATIELQEVLYASGAADTVLATWQTLLAAEAGDLVDSATLDAEVAAIADYVAAASDD